MELKIIYAKNKEDMETIEGKLTENKFKKLSSENNYILMKKRRYGNIVIQLGLLIFALFLVPIPYAYIFIFIIVIYFSYSYLIRSPNVLITTETKDVNGQNLEFSTIDEVLELGNAIL